MDSTDDRELESFLKEHPQLLAMLFAAVVPLAQAGGAAAGIASTAGP